MFNIKFYFFDFKSDFSEKIKFAQWTILQLNQIILLHLRQESSQFFFIKKKEEQERIKMKNNTKIHLRKMSMIHRLLLFTLFLQEHSL